VGCFDGHLVRAARPRVADAVGLDPLVTPGAENGIEFIRDAFPAKTPLEDASFDCVSMLAVLEHMDDPQAVATECHRILRPGGRVVLTVPSPLVDHIIWGLQRLRLLDGICKHQHHGFDVEQTPAIFQQAGFKLNARERFQLGLNNVFVFEKPGRCSRRQIEPHRRPGQILAGLVPAAN
jgi:SAM-dependent methyltransferase